MLGLYRKIRRASTLHKWAKGVGDGLVDPRVCLALALGNTEAPDALYVPVPKAANTTLRTALLPTYGLSKDEVRRVHRDPRLDVRPIQDALAAAKSEAYVFTVVRHPATRILSAYANKIGPLKPRFGHAARLCIAKTDSFDTFLEILAGASPWAIDSHFKPQSCWLNRALKDERLEVFKMEALADDWPRIYGALDRCLPIAPAKDLDILNRSKGEKNEFTARQMRLIDAIYEDDFERFGYSWADLGLGS